jgi:hypothetical protein
MLGGGKGGWSHEVAPLVVSIFILFPCFQSFFLFLSRVLGDISPSVGIAMAPTYRSQKWVDGRLDSLSARVSAAAAAGAASFSCGRLFDLAGVNVAR